MKGRSRKGGGKVTEGKKLIIEGKQGRLGDR